MSHTMKLWERVIEHRLKKPDNRLQKLVWFYAWEVHHEDDFLNKIIYWEISGTEGPTYIFINWKKHMIKIKNISCDRRLKRNEFQQSMFHLLRICT
jgi:hypothetical protein